MIIIERIYLFNEKDNLSMLGIALICQGLFFNLAAVISGKIISNEGIALIIALVLSLIPVVLYTGKDVLVENLKKRNKKFGVVDIVIFVCVLFLVNTITSVPFSYIEKILNVLGYTSISVTNSNTSANSPFLMFYIIILAPAIEEIIYRGVVMRNIEKYSVPAAILISSILFGIMHENISQSPSAIIGGLIMAFVANRYSVKFSFIIHLINNLIGQITRIAQSMGNDVSSLYIIGLYFLAVTFLIIGLIIRRKSIVRSVKKVKEKIDRKNRNCNSREVLKDFFTRKSVIILILIDICLTIYNIKRV